MKRKIIKIVLKDKLKIEWNDMSFWQCLSVQGPKGYISNVDYFTLKPD